jgi:hypothetical protein
MAAEWETSTSPTSPFSRFSIMEFDSTMSNGVRQ